MGTHCSSELRRGHKGIIIMKLLLLTALAAVASAEPGWYYPGVYNSPTLQWPGVSGPGFSSTLWGAPGYCGKRSAEPDAYYGYGLYHPFAVRHLGSGVAAHPGFATSYTQRSPQGLRGKRSAEAEPYYGYLHQQAWPSVRAPGFSATTYGARPYGYYWG